MGRVTRLGCLWAGALVLCAGCSTVDDPPALSQPDGPAAEWAGVYEGRCLLTCPDVGAYEREMTATLILTQVQDEIHVQLNLVPHLAYSPHFMITGPVGSATIINFHIEQEGVFRYNADIFRSGDHVGGALWVTDLDDMPYWTAFCIEVDR